MQLAFSAELSLLDSKNLLISLLFFQLETLAPIRETSVLQQNVLAHLRPPHSFQWREQICTPKETVHAVSFSPPFKKAQKNLQAGELHLCIDTCTLKKELLGKTMGHQPHKPGCLPNPMSIDTTPIHLVAASSLWQVILAAVLLQTTLSSLLVRRKLVLGGHKRKLVLGGHKKPSILASTE